MIELLCQVWRRLRNRSILYCKTGSGDLAPKYKKMDRHGRSQLQQEWAPNRIGHENGSYMKSRWVNGSMRVIVVYTSIDQKEQLLKERVKQLNWWSCQMQLKGGKINRVIRVFINGYYLFIKFWQTTNCIIIFVTVWQEKR